MTLAEAVAEMTPQSVADWLQAPAGAKRRYEPLSRRKCLLAQYLTAQVGDGICVGDKTATLNGDAVYLPDWVVKLIARMECDTNYELSAAECLTMVREVTA